VSTIVGGLPPHTRTRRGGPRWAELVRLRRRPEIRRLLQRLRASGIETRITSGSILGRQRQTLPATVVLVPRVEIEDARFVLLQISFEGPSTAEIAALAARVRRRVAAALAGGLLLVTVLFQTLPPPQPRSALRCGTQVTWARLACSSIGSK
jgi:hypothetical protein